MNKYQSLLVSYNGSQVDNLEAFVDFKTNKISTYSFIILVHKFHNNAYLSFALHSVQK